jgi:hypothetical protein
VKSGRFFVTAVVLLGMAGFVACDSHRVTREKDGQKAHDDKAALVQEGNAKIVQIQALQESLSRDFGVVIAQNVKGIRAQSQRAHDLADKLTVLRKEARRELQGKLAQLLQLINRVLEIDSKNLITIENREKIFASRDSAELVQKSVEDFERVSGENYDPKDDAQPRAHRAASNND